MPTHRFVRYGIHGHPLSEKAASARRIVFYVQVMLRAAGEVGARLAVSAIRRFLGLVIPYGKSLGKLPTHCYECIPAFRSGGGLELQPFFPELNLAR